MGPEGGRPGRPTQAVNALIMSRIAPEQNAFKFKIAPHKQKSIVKLFFFGRKMGPVNGALCLSTPKHNDKSGTGPPLIRPFLISGHVYGKILVICPLQGMAF